MGKIKDHRIEFLIGGVIVTSVLLFLLLAHCISDFGEIFLAIISGLWASFMTLLTEEGLKQHKFSSRLKYLSGDWTGHEVVGREINEAKKSDAIINYLGDTTLEMTVTHSDKRTWHGVLEMNEKVLSKGGLTFKYNNDKEAGYKEVLVANDDNYHYLYLFPITNRIFEIEKLTEGEKWSAKYDYGIELFRMKKINKK